MGITSGRTIKPRRAESSKPTTRLVRKRPRCTPCTAREPDYISNGGNWRSPRYYSSCKRDSSRWMYRRARPIGFSMRHAFVVDDGTVRLERLSGTRRTGDWILFFSSRFFTFSIFAFHVHLFFFFSLCRDRGKNRFHRSRYHMGIALDSWTFGVTITASGNYESRIIICSHLVCRTRGSCAL